MWSCRISEHAAVCEEIRKWSAPSTTFSRAPGMYAISCSFTSEIGTGVSLPRTSVTGRSKAAKAAKDFIEAKAEEGSFRQLSMLEEKEAMAIECLITNKKILPVY